VTRLTLTGPDDPRIAFLTQTSVIFSVGMISRVGETIVVECDERDVERVLRIARETGLTVGQEKRSERS
jgi:hypothetical protein